MKTETPKPIRTFPKTAYSRRSTRNLPVRQVYSRTQWCPLCDAELLAEEFAICGLCDIRVNWTPWTEFSYEEPVKTVTTVMTRTKASTSDSQ